MRMTTSISDQVTHHYHVENLCTRRSVTSVKFARHQPDASPGHQIMFVTHGMNVQPGARWPSASEATRNDCRELVPITCDTVAFEHSTRQYVPCHPN